jgi:hypothetical protein
MHGGFLCSHSGPRTPLLGVRPLHVEVRGGPERLGQDLKQPVRVISMHPMACVFKKMDSVARPADALLIGAPPPEGTVLRLDKVEADALDWAEQEGPQRRLLV